MKTEANGRGFYYGEFYDRNQEKCSIQDSSIATENCIWLGIDDANPQIMASLAKENGVKTNKTTGWVKYPIPDEVLLSTRMHLNQEQAKELIEVLQKFVDTGSVE